MAAILSRLDELSLSHMAIDEMLCECKTKNIEILESTLEYSTRKGSSHGLYPKLIYI